MKVKIEHALGFYEHRLAIRTEELKRSEAEWLKVKAKKTKAMGQWFERFVCYIFGQKYEYKPGLWSDWEFQTFRCDAKSVEYAKNNIAGVTYRKYVLNEKFHELPDDFVNLFLKWWQNELADEYQKLKDDYGLTDNI